MRQYGMVLLLGAIVISGMGCAPQTTTKSSTDGSTEAEAKSTLGSLLFDQQTYFMENNVFADSVTQLKSGLLTETKSYQYRFTPQPDREKGMVITATSKKPELRSFTGVAFATTLGKEKITITQLCETIAASKIAPAAPANPKQASDKLSCPTGSRASYEVVAHSW